jgi:predicted enzyme related to lactoylglutathione lyase
MPQEAGVTRPVWLGYVYVANVDATVAAASADGATLCVPPTDIPGVGRFAMLQDPQGVGVYVMAPAPQSGESTAFAPKARHCQWNELVTTDPVAAVAFYVKHFGWQKGETMSMGPMGDYQFLIGGGQRFGAAMKRGDPAARPIWRYYFGVDDIDRAAQAIVAGGGRLLRDPEQVPGGAYAAAAIDPQGAEFGIAGPRKT